ncbi:MAG TPA: hypothetical protein PK103_00035 [Elusimicrobiales bacterium]|nr:hypothetical protein [Elusimicrobiales bacterium]HOL61733.1 hypothetical protein [Elusimicrobiales bacterium]HPO94928.1 hypothetical protein [Elusimicrobiales bacterium]
MVSRKIKSDKKINHDSILKNTVTKLKIISFILKKQKNKKAKKIEYIAKKLEEELNS